MTSGLLSPHSLVLSSDGAWVYFGASGEIFRVSAEGGFPERLTFLDSMCTPMCCRAQEAGPEELLFLSSHRHPFGLRQAFSWSAEEGVKKLAMGAVEYLFPQWDAQGEKTTHGKGLVVQRQGYGYERRVRWHRYQGGAAGTLWIDREGKGEFHQLLANKVHNLLRPLWLGDRIYFISDFEGRGNIYSCHCADTGDASDLTRHTHYEDFYVQHISAGHSTSASTKSLVPCITYAHNGDIHILDCITHEDRLITPSIASLRKGLESYRRKESPAQHLSSFDLHPKSPQWLLTTRGRIFQLSAWKGPVYQRGERDGVRYRSATYSHDGKLFIAVEDRGKESDLMLFSHDVLTDPVRLGSAMPNSSFGKIVEIYASPKAPLFVLENHRHELILCDVTTPLSPIFTTIDHSPSGSFCGLEWSGDGQWLTYSRQDKPLHWSIQLFHIADKARTTVIPAHYQNFSPSFDPEGRYLYFLSSRDITPSMHSLHFRTNLAPATRLFVVTLQNATLSPFLKPLLDPLQEEKKEPENPQGKEDAEKEKGDKENDGKENGKGGSEVVFVIETEGIGERIEAFPLPARFYTRVCALNRQSVVYRVTSGDEDAGDGDEDSDEAALKAQEHGCKGGKKKGGKRAQLLTYDIENLKEERLADDVDDFILNASKEWLGYSSSGRLRLISAGGKPDADDASFRQGGWLDWSRIVLTVAPLREWSHMFDEAWALQKEFFWNKGMSGVDWEDVYTRYRPCVDRIASLSELFVLIADMQGELGTSHAYIYAHEVSLPPIGKLGASLSYDQASGAYRIDKIDRGISWRAGAGSPLLRPGLGIAEGDLVWAIGGQRLSPLLPPEKLLVEQVNQGVSFVVSDPKGEEKRSCLVFPLAKTDALLYTDWVLEKRAYTHEKSEGKVGYIHIPDMSMQGLSAFLDGWLNEFDREGLIVDARFNGGGFVSPFIFDYLSRKRLGYDQSRWEGLIPYPLESPRGPMVALINGFTGSDGDMFSYGFRKLGLGPLIGKRTWGGVVGISVRYNLIDGTHTTQPEYAIWLDDVGWTVENKGVSPDSDVDLSLEDEAHGRDPQLDRGIHDVLERIAAMHAQKVPIGPAPSLAPPVLPHR